MLVLLLLLMWWAPPITRTPGKSPALPRSPGAELFLQDEEADTPLDLDQVIQLVGVLPDRPLAGQIGKRGINFRATAEIIRSLKEKGAGPITLAALERYLSNRPPSVSLRTDIAAVAQGGLVRVIAEATDPDSDSLLFQWGTTGGTLSGDGAEVTLDTGGVPVSARATQVTVNVTVGDRKGGFASANASVSIRNPNSHAGERLAVSASNEGKYIVVTLIGATAEPDAAQGAVDVVLSQRGGVNASSHAGNLPGVPCRADFIGLENVAEYSFKEPPGLNNGWSKAVLRLRPKDRSRDIKFSLGWQILGEPPQR